ncbi:MAG: signal recognition particle subunit SRP19/SEC65 family protein [Thermoplasmataceae archaeon]|jgi:signal recognition particle subunit SRP19
MRFTVYSQYFNEKHSKRYGRKITKKAAHNFNEQKLVDFIRSINAEFEVKECRYPRTPWEPCKMYTIEAKIKKTTFLKMFERHLA